jgi:hypothetical protein
MSGLVGPSEVRALHGAKCPLWTALFLFFTVFPPCKYTYNHIVDFSTDWLIKVWHLENLDKVKSSIPYSYSHLIRKFAVSLPFSNFHNLNPNSHDNLYVNISSTLSLWTWQYTVQWFDISKLINHIFHKRIPSPYQNSAQCACSEVLSL